MTLVSVCALAAAGGVVLHASTRKVFTAITFHRWRLAYLVAAECAAIAAAALLPSHKSRAIALGFLFVGFSIVYARLLARRSSCNCFGPARMTSPAGLLWRSALAGILFVSASVDLGNHAAQLALLTGAIFGAASGLVSMYRPVPAARMRTPHSDRLQNPRGETGLLSRRSALQAVGAAAAGMLAGPLFRPQVASAASGLPYYICSPWRNACTNCCYAGCYGTGCLNGCNGCFSYCMNSAGDGKPFCTSTLCWS